MKDNNEPTFTDYAKLLIVCIAFVLVASALAYYCEGKVEDVY